MEIYRDGALVTLKSDEAAEIERQQAADAARKQVPASVTNFQARAVLKRQGLFDHADTLIRAGKDGSLDEQIAYQAWEFGNEFQRWSPTVARLAVVFGLSDEQVDDLFIEAKMIEA